MPLKAFTACTSRCIVSSFTAAAEGAPDLASLRSPSQMCTSLQEQVHTRELQALLL